MRLVSMSVAGEVYITSDGGVLHRHHKYLDESPIEISPEEAEKVSWEHGFNSINEDFSSLDEVKNRVNELTPKVPLTGDPEELKGVIERYLARHHS